MKFILNCVVILLFSSQLAQADLKTAAQAMKEKNYSTALKEYGKEADKGNANAAFQIGRIFATKDSGYYNLESAFKWYRQAADLKNEYASYLTGVFYIGGLGTPKDFEQAKSYLEFAAEESVVNANVALAEIAMFEKDYTNARKWLNNFVESTANGKLQKTVGEVNSSQALFTLATLSLDGLGGPVDIDTAHKYFSEFAVNGVPDAQHALARILTNSKNEEYYAPSQGLAWAITAKINGSEKVDELINQAKSELSHEELKQSVAYLMQFYRQSIKALNIMSRVSKPSGSSVEFGVSRTIKLPRYVRDWLDKASMENFPDAAYTLALLYEKRDTVNRDIVKAIKYYRRAAENGNLDAMRNLANISMNNQDGHQNFEEARKWLSVLVENEDATAAKSLARLYHTGRGGQQSTSKAIELYKFSAGKGNVEAQTALDKIYSEQGSAQ